MPKGVAIVGVYPDGPAHQAGMRPFTRARDGSLVVGDVIVALGGKELASLDDLLSAIERHQPGETVTVTVARGNQPVDLPVRRGVGN